jgi:hypothetical protein
MMQLQDERQTKVIVVTLAETTPVLEAARLQEDLRRAGIEPWAWVINNSLAAAQTPGCRCLTTHLPTIRKCRNCAIWCNGRKARCGVHRNGMVR